ncbi:hypothetical protein C8R44DRAFT_957496 [Mycena epipterygia]|nr:hypothetical protein C8R44DRAFT_957496 [Mycena epipterygia]
MSSTVPSNATTHASRNPAKAVQEARSRKKAEPLSDSQKATRKEQAARRQMTTQDFNDDIDKFYAYRGKIAVELAEKYGRTVEYIQALLINASQFKTTRTITLRNTIIHDISVKGKEDGKNLKLSELQALADQQILDGPPCAEEEERLINQLHAARELKRVGLRASNVTAAVDTRVSVAGMQDNLMGLFERTGTRGFAFFTRGHLDDTAMPTFVQSGDSAAFCVEVLKTSAEDLLCKFEQWSCNRAQAQVQKDTRTGLASQTSKLIEDKLHELIHNDTVAVSYKNMEVDMNEAWKVIIAGWPLHIAITCPSAIKGIERLRTVRDGWLNGTINWVAMSPEEIEVLTIDLAARRAKNGGTLKKRKARTDAGGTHKKASKGKGKGKACQESDGEESAAGNDDEDDDDDHSTPLLRAPSMHIAAAATDTALLAAAVDAATLPAVLTSPIPGATLAASHPTPVIVVSVPTPNAIPGANAHVDGFAPTSFIQYTPPAPLGDRSNGKRKAPAEGEHDDAPAKKVRKKRADAGVPRGPRGSATAGGSTSGPSTSRPRPTPKPAHRPGSGYKVPTASKPTKHRDDEVTRRVIAQTKEREAEAAAHRAAATLASQLPPDAEAGA